MCSFTMVARSQKKNVPKIVYVLENQDFQSSWQRNTFEAYETSLICCLPSMIFFYSMIKTKVFLKASSTLG